MQPPRLAKGQAIPRDQALHSEWWYESRHFHDASVFAGHLVQGTPEDTVPKEDQRQERHDSDGDLIRGSSWRQLQDLTVGHTHLIT